MKFTKELKKKLPKAHALMNREHWKSDYLLVVRKNVGSPLLWYPDYVDWIK